MSSRWTKFSQTKSALKGSFQGATFFSLTSCKQIRAHLKCFQVKTHAQTSGETKTEPYLLNDAKICAGPKMDLLRGSHVLHRLI